MYKVFKVEEGWMIYWCPSAPRHYADKVPYDGRVYTLKQAAYRRIHQLRDRLAKEDKNEQPRQVAV